jgi:hypothetical protein
VVYYEQPPDDREKPPGCLEALFITRAVFGVILIPFVLMLSVIIDVAIAFLLYGIHPALALIPLALTIAGVWAYARWEQHKFRPPDM